MAEDASVSINVTANDLNADANLNEQAFGLQLVASAQHGHVELLAGGSFRYTPDANYYGQDSFTYRYSDGTASLEGTSEAARVTITITPVNDAPVAQDVTLTIAEDNTATINLIAVDADSALASLQFAIETQSVVERGTCLQAATTSRSAPTVLAAATRGLRCGTFLAWMPNPLSKRLCRCWGIYRWWIGCQ